MYRKILLKRILSMLRYIQYLIYSNIYYTERISAVVREGNIYCARALDGRRKNRPKEKAAEKYKEN
jgi:hypothetical protein